MEGRFKKIRKKIADFIYPEHIDEVNLRLAKIMNNLDPFEPVLKLFYGVFSEEYERPEDKLDARSQMNLKMWAYQMYKDPSFKYITDWLMNTFGNETLKRAPISAERTQYGRAQISTMILFKKEMERLSNLHEDAIKPEENFDKNITVDL